MNTWILVFILSLSVAANQDQIALGDFSNCIKNSVPCGWEKFKSIKGVQLQHDSLGYFVTMKSVKDVQGISRRIQFDVSNFSNLQWRWKVREFPDGGREDMRKKNDCAAGIFIAFKGIYPFNHVIKYAWSATLPEGAMIPSPCGKNTMIFVVQSGPAHKNEWLVEKRDILADYRKAFGSSPPPAEGIALQTDSDNTETSASADYAEIIVSKK
jgi:hypothetical protein